MRYRNTMIVILTVLLFGVLYYLSLSSVSARAPDYSYKSFPMTIKSKPMSDLIPLIKEKVKFIKEKSSLLQPYKKDSLAFLERNIDQPGITLPQLVLRSFLMPNSDVGSIPISPMTADPMETTTFQFGQGGLGWYFHYGTFVDSPASYFIYVCRMETVPAKILQDKNIPLGSTAYYSIVGGVGVGGNWNYSPFGIFEGEYTKITESTFMFKGVNMPPGWSCDFISPANGMFGINLKWNKDGKSYGFASSVRSLRPPFMNNPQACIPCVGGAGSLYWSYTSQMMDADITIDSKVSSFKDGVGWMDHQWLNSNVFSNYVNLLSNVSSTFNNKGRGLKRYIWLNLNVDYNLQYMLNIFPTKNLQVNDVLDVKYNKYDSDDVQWNLDGKAIVLATVNVNGTDFPTKYTVKIDGREFELSGEMFGTSVTIDVSNNFHWTGSATVKENGKLIGVGFMEANRLQDDDTYISNTLNAAGLDNSNVAYFRDRNLSFYQASWSFFIAISLILVSILLVYNIYKYIRDK